MNRFDKELICIGEKVRKLRKQKKFSQEELAAQVEVSVMTISRIESGSTLMNIQTLIRLSEVLETSPEDILCRDMVKTW